MRHIKLFESFSQFNPIMKLPGFNFFRRRSEVYGDCLVGRRDILPTEDITIYQKGNTFHLSIRRSPGYFKDLISAGMPGWEEDWFKTEREWNINKEFEDIESIVDFLTSFEWYDKVK